MFAKKIVMVSEEDIHKIYLQKLAGCIREWTYGYTDLYNEATLFPNELQN